MSESFTGIEHLHFRKNISKSPWFHGWELESNYGGFADIVNDELYH